jgi:hypothetical protein
VSLRLDVPDRVRRGHRTALRVVALGERSHPRGVVRLRIGDQVVRSRLVDGRARILWTPRGLGERTITVRYAPADGFKPATVQVRTTVHPPA